MLNKNGSSSLKVYHLIIFAQICSAFHFHTLPSISNIESLYKEDGAKDKAHNHYSAIENILPLFFITFAPYNI